MGCNSCKGNKKIKSKLMTSENKVISNNYFINFFIFLLSFVISILLYPYFMWLLFKYIVLNESINIMDMFTKIAPLFTKKEEVEEYEDIQTINEDEVELLTKVDEIE